MRKPWWNFSSRTERSLDRQWRNRSARAKMWRCFVYTLVLGARCVQLVECDVGLLLGDRHPAGSTWRSSNDLNVFRVSANWMNWTNAAIGRFDQTHTSVTVSVFSVCFLVLVLFLHSPSLSPCISLVFCSNSFYLPLSLTLTVSVSGTVFFLS